MNNQPNRKTSDDGAAVARVESVEASSHLYSRMASFLSSGRKVVTVVKDEPLLNAIKVMSKYDFSQVPVVKRGGFEELREENIYGVLSLEGICDEMIHPDFDLSRPISTFFEGGAQWSKCRDFDMIKDVAGKLLETEYEYVLVLDEKKVVKGLVTYYDVAARYVEMVEPFSAIESVERVLRNKLAVLTPIELGTAETEFKRRNAGQEDIPPIPKEVDDLEFHEYQYLINKFWDRLDFPCDLEGLNQVLPAVNKIRNSVMHFRPEGFTEDDRMEVNWLKKLLRI